jgi:hypothetical protein
MIWLAPGALAALVMVAGPVLVHFLVRRHARRVMFPATHFVRAMQAASVRLRRPSDVLLLLLRMGIVASAVLAAAQPLLPLPWRVAQWNARTARAVIVDRSRSMPAPELATRLADQETSTAVQSRRIDTADFGDGIQQAVDWLRMAVPAKREIVLVSDFQRAVLDDELIGRVPPGIGLRFIRAGVHPSTRTTTLAPVTGWHDAEWRVSATVDLLNTGVVWSRVRDTAALSAVTIAAPSADTAAADRALRAAYSFGIPGPRPEDAERGLVVAFAGADASQSAGDAVKTPWIVEASHALRRSDLVLDSGVAVQTLERSGKMIVVAGASATSVAAPALIRASILAMRRPIADDEAEVATVPDADLARWHREPGPVRWRNLQNRGTESDARWFWGLAGLQLALESWTRRQRRLTTIREVHAAA